MSVSHPKIRGFEPISLEFILFEVTANTHTHTHTHTHMECEEREAAASS